jgi:hypothetical protein
MEVRPETIRHIDHEQRQIRRIGDACRGDVHKVFEAPGLFGIPEIQFNGMIINDKFCCTRWGVLQLSWWRRPLRLRREADHDHMSEL